MMNVHGSATARRVACAGLFAALALTVVGCGSTTRVYEARKTIVYDGQMYNVTDTRQFTATAEGRLPDGQTADLTGIEKKAFQQLLDAHRTIDVRMTFHFDELELVYRSAAVKSWRDLQSMQSDFSRAGRDIAKLMEEEKSTQVELR